MNIASIFDEELSQKTEKIAEEFGAVEKNDEEIIIEEEKGKEELDDDEEEEILPKKKKLKKDLINDILELQEKLGGNEFTETILSKNKKEDLEKILAISFEKLVKKNEVKKSKSKELCTPAVENLYVINILFAGLLENGGNALKHKTENINLLEGLKESFEESQDELKMVLTKIYEENTEIINQYCSATTLYLAYLSRQIGFTAMNNLKKKKQKQNVEED